MSKTLDEVKELKKETEKALLKACHSNIPFLREWDASDTARLREEELRIISEFEDASGAKVFYILHTVTGFEEDTLEIILKDEKYD